jgi:hypothetical protein
MEVNQNKSRKKGLFIGLGLFAAGMLSFFGYQYWKSHKKTNDVPQNDAPDFTAEKPKKTKPPVSKTKKASAKKHGTKPSGGSDTNKNNPASSVIDTLKEKVADPSLIAKGLYVAIKAKSFNAALRILKVIHNSLQYAEVSRSFSKYFIGGVRQTIVNAMFSTFKTVEQKQKLKQAFAKIGLKYDGKKWTLEGTVNRKFIITTHPTKVWKDPRTSVEVPKNMVLGKEIAKRKNHTLFENGRQYFLVHSGHVNHYRK